MNELILDGTVVELDDIRFTPGNVSIRNFRIHFKDLTRKQLYKHVEFEINAIVVGDLVEKIELHKDYQFKGFLDKRSQKSSQLTFHVQEYKTRS